MVPQGTGSARHGAKGAVIGEGKIMTEMNTTDKKMQMEELIGQLCTTKEDKSYLATSMRQVGDDYLFLMLPLDKSLEPFVGSFQYKDDELIMFEYVKSDRDEILRDFMSNALNDLQTIRTKNWMDEVQ